MSDRVPTLRILMAIERVDNTRRVAFQAQNQNRPDTPVTMQFLGREASEVNEPFEAFSARQ